MRFSSILLMGFVAATVNVVHAQQYGPVKPGDTLWNILSQYKTEKISMSQLLANTFDANKQAFHENNINRLKQGATLLIPTIEAVEKRQPAPAVMPIVRQSVAKEKVMAARQLAELKEDSQQMVEDVPPPQFSLAPQKGVEKRALKIRYSYAVAAAYDDNVRRAQHAEDIRDDYKFSASIRARTTFKLSSQGLLGVNGKLEYEKYATFDILDNLVYTVGADYQWVPSSGFYAPRYSLKLSLGGIESDSVMRTSNIAKIGLELNKRLSRSLHMTAGYAYKYRDSQSEVFDTRENQFFANLDIEFKNHSVLYLTGHYIIGDIVSSATPSLNIKNAAEAIEPDDAFGGVAANQFAYKIEASSVVLTVGYNTSISRSLAVDLSARFIQSEADQSDKIYYDRSIFLASLLGRF